jgi:predicted transcriptional regulator
MYLSQDGLHIFFNDYQVDSLRSLGSEKGLNSRQVLEAVGEKDISRASIINFLASAVENGLLDVSFETGKGGYRGIYKPKYNEEGTKEVIKKVFKERLDSL